MAKRTSVIRVSDEFMDVLNKIKEDNGLDTIPASIVIARRLKAKPEKLTWNII